MAYNLTATSRQTGGAPANQTTATTYTETNKPSQITDPLGYLTSLGYNQLDQHSSTTDPEVRTRQYFYDDNGRLYQIIDANGEAEETRSYYPGGYLESITDANDNTSTFARDGYARVTKLTYPDSTFESWGYDNNGNATSHTTRGGNLISQTFDGKNRVLTRSPAGEPEVTIVYDAAGRLLTASKPLVAGDPSSGIFSRGYDAAGRLTSESSPNQTTPSPAYDVVGYQLDANGNVTQITYPSGYTVQKTYDAQDRLTAIFLNGATTAAATFSYDGLNRRLSKTYNNGTSAAYAYDISNNLLDLDLTYGGASSVYWDYGFNTVHQMLDKSVTDATYEWQPAATVTTMYGAANKVNEYPTVGGVPFSYNADGCLINDGNFSYIYNTERMLTQVKNTAGTVSIASYSYDPFLRQTQKAVVGGAKTRYVYSGSQMLEEYDCTGGLPGTLVRRYIYAGANEPILQMDGSGNITYLHHDNQGSLIAQTNSSGTVLNKYVYSAFGETTSLNNGSSTIGYTGQRYDEETGLFYYKARYYNSTIGRFLQPDPTGYQQGMNLYGYVHNDPLNRTDPDGNDDKLDLTGYSKSGFWDSVRSQEQAMITQWSKQSGDTLATVRFLSEQRVPVSIPGGGRTEPGLFDIKDQLQQMGAPVNIVKDAAIQGNYNYGYIGASRGVASDLLRQGAGAAQFGGDYLKQLSKANEAGEFSKLDFSKLVPSEGLMRNARLYRGDNDPDDVRSINLGIQAGEGVVDIQKVR